MIASHHSSKLFELELPLARSVARQPPDRGRRMLIAEAKKALR
jgi:hypothetical protein